MTPAKERALVNKFFALFLSRLEHGPSRRLRSDPKKLAVLRLRVERAIAGAGDLAETAYDVARRVFTGDVANWSEGLFTAFDTVLAELRSQIAPPPPVNGEDMF
jgi:hypothetical protein